MKTPLEEIIIQCATCRDMVFVSDINSGDINFHNEQGTACRFPKEGLTDEQIVKVKAIAWTCELCHEEAEEMR